jgi:ankyrin repeat protein
LSIKTKFKTDTVQLTPLMIAAAKGHEKTAKKLMRFGALWRSNDNSTCTQQRSDVNC